MVRGNMQASNREKNLFGLDIKIVDRTDDCTVYKMETADGEGVMTSYRVFPGVELMYNDFRTSSCFQDVRLREEIMEINHCREGRFECQFQNGTYGYLESGDLAVNMLSNRITESCFPLEYYKGIGIIVYLEEASTALSSIFDDISIDLYALRDTLCASGTCFIMRAKEEIQHIFSELYTIPEEIRKGYIKLKVLELFLFLSVTTLSDPCEPRRYFPKQQVEIIKQIKKYITENMETRFTLKELSLKFGIGLTSMKLCFKGVYGASILAYIKAHRMKVAAYLLRQSPHSIMTIAGKVGYENPSKFAAAFKDVMGISPLKYR